MNCKPGDLAVAFLPGPHQNKLFFIIEAAPVGVGFKLPDGFPHVPVGSGFWIVESAGSLLNVKTDHGRRHARFAVGGDAGLRPIRDNPGADESLSWAGLPHPSKEHSSIGGE